MGRRAFIISLFAFLGFVILQTVSAEEPSDELTAELNSNAGSLLKTSENQFRLIRSPDADPAKKQNRPGSDRPRNGGKGRKPWNVNGDKGEKPKYKKRNGGKVKGKGGKGKANGKEKGNKWGKPWSKKRRGGKAKGSGKGKGDKKKTPWYKKIKEGKGKGKGKGKKEKLKPSIGVKQATCDEKELCKRIKLYIKYSNQQRKAKRILRTCKTMKNKHDKAGTEFEATAAAIKDSDDTNVTAIQAVLEKCKTTAKAVCALTNVAECADAEQTKINGCITKLKAWIDAFGPGSTSCLGQENCCSCINGIEPPVPDECLSYDETDKKSLGKKNMCTKSESGGGGTGSFGECRKKQQAAAEQGPPAFGKKCKNGGMTTAKPSGRRRKAVLKIRKELNIKK